jgi:hypothetical protein
MSIHGWLKVAILLALVAISTPILGNYLARLYTGQKVWGDRLWRPIERGSGRPLAGPPRPARGPDHVLRLPPDDGDAVKAVDIAQQACKEYGSPERKIDLGFVLDVKDDGDARGCHFIFSLG